MFYTCITLKVILSVKVYVPKVVVQVDYWLDIFGRNVHIYQNFFWENIEILLMNLYPKWCHLLDHKHHFEALHWSWFWYFWRKKINSMCKHFELLLSCFSNILFCFYRFESRKFSSSSSGRNVVKINLKVFKKLSLKRKFYKKRVYSN